MKKVDDIKTQLSNDLDNFKNTFKRLLKKNIKTRHAYDLMAVARGFKDYSTAKGLDNAFQYSVRANLGVKGESFWVTKALGQHDSDLSAAVAAKKLLETCNEPLLWVLYNGSRPTRHTFNTQPRTSGFHMQITVRANSKSEAVAMAAEGMSEMTKHCVGKTVTYSKHEKLNITTSGKAVNAGYFGERKVHFEEAVRHAIIDIDGVVDQSAFANLKDDFSSYMNGNKLRGALRHPIGDMLYFCQSMTEEDIEQAISDGGSHKRFIMAPSRTRRSLKPFIGNIADCMHFAKDNPNYIFNAYRVVDECNII